MHRIILALLLCTLASCDFPRGESHTLNQVGQDAKARYSKAVGAVKNDAEVTAALSAVEQDLEALAQDPSQKARAQKVSDALYSLFSRAGQTSRPAFYQLAQQYAALASGPVADKSTVELLVSRTYGALASEAETTGFKVRT